MVGVHSICVFRFHLPFHPYKSNGKSSNQKISILWCTMKLAFKSYINFYHCRKRFFTRIYFLKICQDRIPVTALFSCSNSSYILFYKTVTVDLQTFKLVYSDAQWNYLSNRILIFFLALILFSCQFFDTKNYGKKMGVRHFFRVPTRFMFCFLKDEPCLW